MWRNARLCVNGGDSVVNAQVVCRRLGDQEGSRACDAMGGRVVGWIAWCVVVVVGLVRAAVWAGGEGTNGGLRLLAGWVWDR